MIEGVICSAMPLTLGAPPYSFDEHALEVLRINYGNIGWKPAEVLAARLLANSRHQPPARKFPATVVLYPVFLDAGCCITVCGRPFGVTRCAKARYS